MVLQCSRGDRAVPHKTPNCYMSLSFCTWYSVTKKVPGFGLNTSCIKSIKSSYKAKSGSKGSCMQGMSKHIPTKREAGEQGVAAEPESGTRTAEERPTRKTPKPWPNAPNLLLPKMSPPRRRHRKGLRLKFHLGASSQSLRALRNKKKKRS